MAPHGNSHVHPHDHAGAHGGAAGHVHVPAQRLGTAMAAAFLILVFEALGGWYGHSLALVSDAGHMLTDVGALALAWQAARWAESHPTSKYTYGYFRAGVLAALANAVTLILVSAWIFYEALQRFAHPTEPAGPVMFVVAAVALSINLWIGLRLGHGENLNVRSAWLHVMGDAAASAGVILGGVVIYFTGLAWVDSLLSVGIACLVFVGTWPVLANALHILMEGAPRGARPAEIAAALCNVPNVAGIHDLHVWSLDAERTALTCHMVVPEDAPEGGEAARRAAAALLRQKFGIAHSTIQTEPPGHGHAEDLLCTSLDSHRN